MTQLLLILTPIALLDATSITPLCIVPLILLMSGPQPVATSTAFLLGIFISYVICFVLVLVGLQSVIDAVARYFVHLWNTPDTPDVWLGIVIGLVMIFFGARLERSREAPNDSRVQAGATPLQAFTGGFALTLIGLPGAIPIFAAADQILRADPDRAGQAIAILFYTAVFVAPLSAVLLVRIFAGDRIEPLLRRISDAMTSWGQRFIVIALIGLGVVFVADGIGWLLGHPLLPTFPDAAGPGAVPEAVSATTPLL